MSPSCPFNSTFISLSFSQYVCFISTYVPLIASHVPTSPFMFVDFLVTVCHFPSFPLHSPCIPLLPPAFLILSPSCPVELPFVSISFPLISCHFRFLSPACHGIFLDFPSCPLHVPFMFPSLAFPLHSPLFPCMSLEILEQHGSCQRFRKKSFSRFSAKGSAKPEPAERRQGDSSLGPPVSPDPLPEDYFYKCPGGVKGGS